MALAFARGLTPLDRLLLPVTLAGGGTRARRTPARRQWLRVADRLAAGLSPEAAAVAEGQGGAQLVESLLAQADFRALVESTREELAEPPDVRRRQLVMLARQTLERAMAWDGDPRAALFVLEEDARGRDPAETLADGVEQARRRALATAAPRPPPVPPPQPPPEAPAPPAATPHDPLQAMVHRGAARLRGMVQVEAALRRAAAHAAAGPMAPATDTVADPARALRRAEPRLPAPVPLRHGLWWDPVTAEPTGLAPSPAAAVPRRARPP